jgi:hypothetical protein
MSQITTISGTVSGVRLDSSITVNTTVSVPQGAVPGTTTSSSETVKTEKMNFRVDNRPVYMPVAINIANGDVVTAAGIQRGEFEAIALTNHTTKTMYWVPKPSTVPDIIYIVVGVLTLMFHKIGWLLIGGAIFFMMGKKNRIKIINEACAMTQQCQASISKTS